MCLRRNESQKCYFKYFFSFFFGHQLVLHVYTFTSSVVYVQSWSWVRHDNCALNLLLSSACTLWSLIYGAWFRSYRCLARSSFITKEKMLYAETISHSKYRYYLWWFPPPFSFSFFHLALGATCSVQSIEPWN